MGFGSAVGCFRSTYFRSAATLSMPALAQASSFSPPGAPDTPTAPMVSLPILIGSAPCAGVMLVRNSAPAFGLPLTPSANSPDDRAERARRVGLLHGVFEGDEAGVGVAHGEDRLALAAEHVHRHVIALRLAGIDGDLRDRGRHGERQILVGRAAGHSPRRRGRRRAPSDRKTGNTIRNVGHENTSLVRAASRAAWPLY